MTEKAWATWTEPSGKIVTYDKIKSHKKRNLPSLYKIHFWKNPSAFSELNTKTVLSESLRNTSN